MSPQWRTTTVIALCRRMLDTREFDAMPILSDALQEAGCTNDEILTQCLDPDLKTVLAERLVNLVFSEETAAAVWWLEQFAENIGYEGDEPPTYSYEQIIALGHRGVTTGSMHFWSDDGADFFRDSDANRREFFRNWSLVTGVAVPEETQETVRVSCAC